jgi:GT2 family glycosyltransferase
MNNDRAMDQLVDRIRVWLKDFPVDQPALVIPIYNAHDDLLHCVHSLAANTPEDVPIMLIDDASTDARIVDSFADAGTRFGRQFGYFRKPKNTGFVGSVNLGFQCAEPRDLVMINSDTTYPPGWLPRLRAAAYSRTTVATATPLTNYGSILSVPYRNRQSTDLPGQLTVAEADECVRKASLRLYPSIPTAIGHCTYFRRSALNVIGFFDEAFAPGYGEEVDLSQRAIIRGYSHVAADDLFVYHVGSASFSTSRSAIQDQHEKLINQRYPWYRNWIHDFSSSRSTALAQAIDAASTALVGRRIAIDITYIAPTTTGTSVFALELVRAMGLAPGRSASLTLLVQSSLPDSMIQELSQYAESVCPISDFRHSSEPTFDLVFRPLQILNPTDLLRLRTIARRFVVMQLDLIAYANPAYVRSYQEWQRYQRATELCFAYADGIAYLSADVEADAHHRGLEAPEGRRTCVAYAGVDHNLHLQEQIRAPKGANLLPGRFLFVLGTNFKHKNRAHMIRIFAALLEKYGWDGQLVLAGPTVSFGGSHAEEQEILALFPQAAAQTLHLGIVDEAEKGWLLKNATVLLYPSISEGFGLNPFEAAQVGTPALTSRGGSLAEVLGDDVVYFESFDPEESADILWTLINDESARTRQTEAIRVRGAEFRWTETASRLWALLDQVVELPPRSVLISQQVDTIHRLTMPGAVDGQTPIRSWIERLNRAFHIVRREGVSSLWAETRQFIRWKLQ